MYCIAEKKFWEIVDILIAMLIAIHQNRTCHSEPLCACSMTHDHKFTELKHTRNKQ